MIELLDWIFASGWRFTGVLLLLLVIFVGVEDIILALKGKGEPGSGFEEDENDE
jgi:hypothetical protein